MICVVRHERPFCAVNHQVTAALKNKRAALREFYNTPGGPSRRRGSCLSAAPLLPFWQAFQHGWRGDVSKMTASPTTRRAAGGDGLSVRPRLRQCTNRRRGCHFSDAPSLSLLKILLKERGVQHNDSLADGYSTWRQGDDAVCSVCSR